MLEYQNFHNQIENITLKFIQSYSFLIKIIV